MADSPLKKLLELLPLHAEEGDAREVIGSAELLDRMAPKGKGRSDAEVALAGLRRLFDALGLLDQRPSMRNKWSFVSFPASLVGHSLLRTLASPNQTLCHSDYWREDCDAPSEHIEEQRHLLRALEFGRIRSNPERSAQPIRYVYAAWALIRLGQQYLLYHREDKPRPEEPNWVFPGGRFRFTDLPIELQVPESLRLTHCSNSKLAFEALPRTLKRELFEELGLTDGEHYVASVRRVIGPYRKVEGAKNRHAYTEYQLKLHDIKLTSQGEARLLERAVNKPEWLAWFFRSDIVSLAGRADGERAFVDALREQLGDSLGDFLESIPDSSGTEYQFCNSAQAVDLPASYDRPFRVGRTGDEKELKIQLSTEQWALLCTIMAYAKGIDLTPGEKHLALLGGGWIKLNSAEAKRTATKLIEALSQANLPLIRRTPNNFVRPNISPDILYFDEYAFRYRLADAGGPGKLEIDLRMELAPWSELAPATLSINLNRSMTRALIAIGSGKDPENYSEDTMKKNIKEMLDSKTQSFGLRKFVRIAKPSYRITVPKAE